jgi:hypothetical protein
MDFRGQESPMDFQWDNSSGTVDPNSPFRMSGIEPTLAQKTPVKKGMIYPYQLIANFALTRRRRNAINLPVFSYQAAHIFDPWLNHDIHPCYSVQETSTTAVIPDSSVYGP